MLPVTRKATARARTPVNGRAKRWTRRVERLKRSGLSIRAFAAREGLAAGSLSHWKWKLERPNHGAPSTAQFIELKTSKASLGDPGLPFEVVLASGRVVRVPSGFNSAELGRLVGVLEEARS